MRVYEITKQFAPAYKDFVPKYIVNQIGKPGFHTLGLVSAMEEAHYGTGILQFYDGTTKKNLDARITYLYIPKEERGESNAWSLLKEMEYRLGILGINRIHVCFRPPVAAVLKDYLISCGFTGDNDTTEILTAPLNRLVSDKLLKLPDSRDVRLLCDVSKAEVMQILGSFGEQALKKRNVDPDIRSDFYVDKLSTVYTSKAGVGISLVTELPEGGLMVRLCVFSGADPLKPMANMISKMSKMAVQLYPKEMPVFIPCRSEKIKKVISSFSSDEAMEPAWQGSLMIK